MAATALAESIINMIFHVLWIDSAATLVILLLLVNEGRRSMHGESCATCWVKDTEYLKLESSHQPG